MRQAFRAILRLYPADYREIFASEMMEVFDQAVEGRRRQGVLSSVSFAIRELIGLLGGLAKEWVYRGTARERYVNSHGLEVDAFNKAAEIVEIEKRLQRLLGYMEFAIANHNFPKARYYSDQERIVREQLDRLMREHKMNKRLVRG